MPTDILLKQLNSSLAELKASIEKFEKHTSPSTQYAEELYNSINASNKMVSAYLVLKEKKDVSPDLDLHIKLMAVPTPQEKAVIVDVEPIIETKPIEVKETPQVEPVIEIKPIEPITPAASVQEVSVKKEYPKLIVNINDKFRFINELFKTNSNEYHIAIEQLNAVNSLDEANAYLKGLKEIYGWDEENEMVKKIIGLTHKRFS
jgi:hypothetical protein